MKIKSIPARAAALFVNFYRRFLSPLTGQNCRFYPTCSSYAEEALRVHGFCKGIVLVLWRLGRCHPWCKTHWHDPVPKRFTWAAFFGYKRKHKPDSGKTEHFPDPDVTVSCAAYKDKTLNVQ